MTLLLNKHDVASLLTMDDAMATVEEAFRQLALGHVTMPQRTVIRMSQYNGVHLGMPAWIGGDVHALALKVVTVYPNNPTGHNLPTIMGVLLLNDPETGAPLAVMDAGRLTAMRTGAVGGVATKYLARAKARTAGIFGAGVQAQTQLQAVAAARRLTRAHVYDIDPEKARAYAELMTGRLGFEVVPVARPRDAVEGMDIIVTASSAQEPVFDGSWLVPGQHINAVGSHSPMARELDTTTVVRSKVFADQPSACLVEAGDLMMPISEGAIERTHVRAGLGEVIAGLKPGREHDSDITLFKSVGLALQDASTASVVYKRALEAGVGTEFVF
jgi:alanine dehydrogenase